VGIRPDHLVQPGQSARGETAKLESKVEIVEPLGNELIVHSRLGEFGLVFRMPPQQPPDTGSTVSVVVELDHLHLFDTDTEKRLTA
jgi:multiple sugar transport system ATP-binding protein